MPRDPQHPISKPTSSRIELAEPFESSQPHLLMKVLGELPIATHQVVDEAENFPKMAIVERGPGCPIAPRQAFEKALFIIHCVALGRFVSSDIQETIACLAKNPSRFLEKNEIVRPNPKNRALGKKTFAADRELTHGFWLSASSFSLHCERIWATTWLTL
jgi:hypothetical protein